jgi:outer membrane receptor for ferrienterochelin and colicin
MISRVLFFIILINFYYNVFSQTNIKGIIIDAGTGEPIPFAIIKNVGNISACNVNGEFKFIVQKIPSDIIINSIGYIPFKLTINKDTFLTIPLQTASYNLNEVNVYASSSRVQASSLQSLKNIEAYNLAGFTKDVFRAVQMLPGVSSDNAGNARFNVRGGTFDENLMLINGIEVAEPYHVKIFPMASLGIFNIDFVQRIDFSAGGFNAEYGDALSSVLSIDYKKANNDSITGKISLGLIDVGLESEIPLSKKSSLMIGARRSDLEPIIKYINPGKISVSYYDIQSKYDYEISPKHKISVLAIYSADKDVFGPQENIYNTNENWVIDNKTLHALRSESNNFNQDTKYNDIIFAITSKHILSARLIIDSQFSFYKENENSPETNKDSVTYKFSKPVFFNIVSSNFKDITVYSIKTLEYKLSGKIMITQSNTLKTGFFVRHSDFDFNRQISTVQNFYNNTYKYPDTVKTIYIPQNVEGNSVQTFKAKAYQWGLFATNAWQATNNIIVNLGVRADYFELNNQLTFSPRTSIAYTILPGLKATASWGIFYKTPIMKQIKYSYITSNNTKSQEAIHYVAGIEKKYNDITMKLEMYYKKYNDLIPVHRSAISELIYDIKDNTAEGYAKGIDYEFILTKKYFDMWFNYSLCEAKERIKGMVNYYSRYTDQRHFVSSLISLKLPKRIGFDFKVTYGSGYAYQLLTFNNVTKQWATGLEIKTGHLPYYSSYDIRFKKEFTLYSKPLQFYADILNVFNKHNVLGHYYGTDSNGKPQDGDETFMGMLPTFGLMYIF